MKLVFEKVDEIWTATGDKHYYRTFPAGEGWVLYIHSLDAENTPARGVPVAATTREYAQAIAQAYEDSPSVVVR